MEIFFNLLCEVVDIVQLVELVYVNNVLLVVDNCFCILVLQQFFVLGVDILLYLVMKFFDGQGWCIGGVVCGSDKLMEEVFGFLCSVGLIMSFFNVWVFLKGLEILSL